MSKRIISIFLCCALCAGFLILPASAASITDIENITSAGTEYINYIFSDSYSTYESYWYTSDSLSRYYSNFTGKFGFKWSPISVEAGSYMLFAVKTNRKPDALSVTLSTQSGSSNTTAIYEGMIPSTPNLYFYRLPLTDAPTTITIWGRYDSSFTGTISIASCFAVKNLRSVYDRAEFWYVPIELRTEGEYIEKTYNVGTEFFPYSSPDWLSSTDNISRVDYTIRADGDRFNTSAVGNVTLLVTTFCESLTATVSLVSKDSSVREIYNIKCNINTDSSWGLVNNYEVGLGTAYNYAAYQIDFDLTGYDMANYDLQIFISVDTVNWVSEGNIGTKLFNLSFRSMTYVPTLLSDPWYKPLVSFFDRVGDNIVSAVNSTKSQLSNYINNFRTNVTTWFSTMDDRWEALMVKLEDYLGSSSEQQDQVDSSIQQNQQQQEQVQDQGESMKEQIDQIEQAENEMLQVPEIDPADLNINTLIPADGMTMMTNVMVTITNNNYVAQLLLLVVCLALVAVMVL